MLPSLQQAMNCIECAAHLVEFEKTFLILIIQAHKSLVTFYLSIGLHQDPSMHIAGINCVEAG